MNTASLEELLEIERTFRPSGDVPDRTDLESLARIARQLPDPRWAIDPGWPSAEPPHRPMVTRITVGNHLFQLHARSDAPGHTHLYWAYVGEIEVPSQSFQSPDGD